MLNTRTLGLLELLGLLGVLISFSEYSLLSIFKKQCFTIYKSKKGTDKPVFNLDADVVSVCVFVCVCECVRLFVCDLIEENEDTQHLQLPLIAYSRAQNVAEIVNTYLMSRVDYMRPET
jgi:hypothetical protein